MLIEIPVASWLQVSLVMGFVVISDWLGGTVQSRRSHRKEEGGKLSFCSPGTDINVLI